MKSYLKPHFNKSYKTQVQIPYKEERKPCEDRASTHMCPGLSCGSLPYSPSALSLANTLLSPVIWCFLYSNLLQIWEQEENRQTWNSLQIIIITSWRLSNWTYCSKHWEATSLVLKIVGDKNTEKSQQHKQVRTKKKNYREPKWLEGELEKKGREKGGYRIVIDPTLQCVVGFGGGIKVDFNISSHKLQLPVEGASPKKVSRLSDRCGKVLSNCGQHLLWVSA